MSELACIFDVGTTGARTIIFDINGKLVAKSYEEYIIPKQPYGISEQDPLIWWRAVKKTCNDVAKKINIHDIIGIAASFQRQTVTFLDKMGTILHPALTWMDGREEVSSKDWFKEEGTRRTIPKVLWIKKNKPEVFKKISKIAYTDTYIYNRLCNVMATDPTNGVMGILNYDTLKWDENLAERFEIPIDLWPDVFFYGDLIGELSNVAANELGLNQNIPIFMGGGDQQCAALGLGVIKTHQAKVTIGTGAFVDYVTDKMIKPSEKAPIFSYPSVIKGKWHIEGAMFGAGSTLKWFKDNFSQFQVNQSTEEKTNIYEMLANEASTIQPGSEGLLFIPLYIFRKGTIHGIGWNHTRAHFIRAIMESACLGVQMCLQILEVVGGKKVSEVRADGGAMNSPLWAQILADVTSKKILIPKVKDSAALGAAILVFYNSERYESLDNAITNMVKFTDAKEPIKQNEMVYKKLYKAYAQELISIDEKNRITGNL
jgi:xylulokinase